MALENCKNYQGEIKMKNIIIKSLSSIMILLVTSLTASITRDIPITRDCLLFGSPTTTNVTIENKTPFPVEILDISGSMQFVEYTGEESREAVINKQIGVINPGKKYRVLSIPRTCKTDPHKPETRKFPFFIKMKLPFVGEIELIQELSAAVETLLARLSLGIKSGDYYMGDNKVEEQRWDDRTHHTVEFRKGDRVFKVTYYSFYNFGFFADIWCEINYQGPK